MALNLNYSSTVDWQSVIETRKQVLKQLEDAKANGIENSLDAGVEIPNTIDHQFLPDLADLFGVSRVKFVDNTTITINDLSDELRCERSWKRDASVAKREDGSILSERDYNAIKKNH